ncbi:MAG TPA: hypothetical protein VJ991_03990 [Balneolales bacterium]|nr:hypothetical protein [Balneolales bacterium]
MTNQLKTLSADLLEHFLKERIDEYLSTPTSYKIKDLNTAYANSRGDKLTFRVEISIENEDELVASH